MWNGKTHDINVFRNEFSQIDFTEKNIHVDLGFYGLAKDNVGGSVIMPHKKPKGKQLTDSQKGDNKVMSKLRAVVENAIGGMKSFFILRVENRFHYHRKTFESLILASSLHNFKLKMSCK